MKIVVTGALGHIGSYLIRRLPDLLGNCDIVMVDDLTTQRFSSLFNLPQGANYRFIEGDVRQLNLDRLFEGSEAVVHLAAITDATSSFDRAQEVEAVNFCATEKVAEACKLVGVPLIIASSTSVYGSQEGQVDENCPISELRPQSPYAKTKLKEENFILNKCECGLDAIIFRFGTIFGVSPGMRFHTAVNKFCWQAVMGAPLTVWSTAYEQKRPYLDLDDCVRAITFGIKSRIYGDGVYNIVTENLTVSEVVKEIKKNIKEIEINYVDHEIMNQLSYEVLNEKIKRKGFIFKGGMSTSVEATINLLRNANCKI